jgi:flagellar biosynthesis/type III secretory pathway M-ring protein FliF/YscJ
LAAVEAAQNSPQVFEEKVTQARAMVGQDAKRVAQVVRTWVNTDD